MPKSSTMEKPETREQWIERQLASSPTRSALAQARTARLLAHIAEDEEVSPPATQS